MKGREQCSEHPIEETFISCNEIFLLLFVAHDRKVNDIWTHHRIVMAIAGTTLGFAISILV